MAASRRTRLVEKRSDGKYSLKLPAWADERSRIAATWSSFFGDDLSKYLLARVRTIDGGRKHSDLKKVIHLNGVMLVMKL